MTDDMKKNPVCETPLLTEQTPFIQAVSCINCGSRGEPVYSGLKNRRSGLNGRYDLLRCTECDLVFLSPRPSRQMLHDLYAGPYHSHTVGTERKGLFKVIKTLCLLPYRLRFGPETGTFPPFGGGRVLDIGCGTGDYLSAMSALGWQCFGCDVSEAALTVARRRLPQATLYQGTFEEISLKHDSFDAVTLWHTLEHLEEPLGVLKHIHNLLVPNGRLVVAVPNIGSFEARVFRTRWDGIDVPYHLYLFSIESLRRLLQTAGLELIQVRPQAHPSTFSDSVGFCLDDLMGVKRSKQRLWLYYALFPFITLSYVFANWSCIELTAVKRSPSSQ